MPIDISGAGFPIPIRNKLQSLADKYDYTGVDHTGGNGYVVFADHKLLRSKLVLKFYYWDNDDKLHAEPRVLKSLSSPHILRVEDADYVDTNLAYYVSPFCTQGNLDRYLSEHEVGLVKAVSMVSDLLSGLCEMHSKRMLHRDLKLSNIYVQDDAPVIGDFGSVVQLPDQEVTVNASRHSILYRPPESFQADTYTFKSDLYQLGIVLYQLLGGSLPYEETAWLSDGERADYDKLTYPDDTIFADACLARRITKGRLLDWSTLHPWIPDALVGLAKKACHLNPRTRPSDAAAFLVALTKHKAHLQDWIFSEGFHTRRGKKSHRVIGSGPYTVQIDAGTGWRNARAQFPPTSTLEDQVKQVMAAN